MAKARFICDISEKNADLYYATGFKAPDPFIFFEWRGKKFLVMNDLEIDRARRESHVDKVLSINDYARQAAGKSKNSSLADIVCEVFKSHGIKQIVIPQNAPFALVDELRKKGIKIEAGPAPFYPERFVKNAEELRCIANAQSAVFAAMALAADILKSSKIKREKLFYKGSMLTSERLRRMINVFLLERDFAASDTIVSCGRHSIDPHDIGRGPLLAHQAIIVDIFPRSIKTLYFGDATRTFCRGRASDELKKMYAVVKDAQTMGLKMVRAGLNGRKLHEAVHELFKKRGYHTGEKGGRRQGFFHATGHSIGLEIHEEPLRFTARDCILKAGNVMSVEPGLYYPGIGGVRIEDLVFVKTGGCDVIGKFPKQLTV